LTLSISDEVTDETLGHGRASHTVAPGEHDQRWSPVRQVWAPTGSPAHLGDVPTLPRPPRRSAGVCMGPRYSPHVKHTADERELRMGFEPIPKSIWTCPDCPQAEVTDAPVQGRQAKDIPPPVTRPRLELPSPARQAPAEAAMMHGTTKSWYANRAPANPCRAVLSAKASWNPNGSRCTGQMAPCRPTRQAFSALPALWTRPEHCQP
jgi:hypothetical protein